MCSIFVLVILLVWVLIIGDLILGGVLLLFYVMGYVVFLILVGIFIVNIKKFLEIRKWFSWIIFISGVLLVGFGVFLLLFRMLLV